MFSDSFLSMMIYFWWTNEAIIIGNVFFIKWDACGRPRLKFAWVSRSQIWTNTSLDFSSQYWYILASESSVFACGKFKRHLEFWKAEREWEEKGIFSSSPPPSSPSHTITLGVDDRQACNPPNKTSPEHSTCFCTSHQLWKMWLVESIQPGKFACLASKLFVRVVELNLFFFSFIQRCEQYAEYDAFIWAPEPSNPWISDDITLWEQDKSL